MYEGILAFFIGAPLIILLWAMVLVPLWHLYDMWKKGIF